MKEFYPELSDMKGNSIDDYPRVNSPFLDPQNKLISPFNSDKKEVIEKSSKEKQSYSKSDNIFPFPENTSGNINNNYGESNINNSIYNNVNDNYPCLRYFLTDQQKNYFQPKNNTFIDKLLDLLFNW